MAITRTTNTGLQKSALNDRNWHSPLQENADAIDAFAAIGTLAVQLAEYPSTTLNVKVSAGSFMKVDGTVQSYAGTASQAMTTAATNYVYLTDGGALTVSTSAWPSTNHVRLAVVTTDATTVTGITDARVCCQTIGNRELTALTAANAGTINSGDATTDTIIGNMRTRIGELEARLQTAGWLP